jgi:hypothetical protein
VKVVTGIIQGFPQHFDGSGSIIRISAGARISWLMGGSDGTRIGGLLRDRQEVLFKVIEVR